VVDQPDNSKIRIEEAYCISCWERLKRGDLTVINDRNRRLAQMGVLIPEETYKPDLLAKWRD
jgi:hypothetical protein